MDWQKTLYPAQWCVIFVIVGLLIWLIKLVSGSNDQVLIFAYYACAVAALVSLCFLLIGVAKFITEGEPAK